MKKWIAYSSRLGALTVACCSCAAFADIGSEKLEAQVAQLQQQLAARHQLADDLLKDALALGYSVPEIAVSQNATMVAKADDDAFTLALKHLQKTLLMFAMLD
jgi:hypothetical protein